MTAAEDQQLGPDIVGLLASDDLGVTRDVSGSDDELQPYLRAFAAVTADPAHLLLVVVKGNQLPATMPLNLLPGLARLGALSAQIEAVRVRSDQRSDGLKTQMFAWAIREARVRGCAIVQLATNDAHRFYERLGFVPSHEGLKLILT